MNNELSKILKSDPTGEAMQRYRRRMAEAVAKAEEGSQGAVKDTSTKAFQAGFALLPVLWRELNRR